MSADPAYQLVLTPSARRALSNELPEKVIEFLTASTLIEQLNEVVVLRTEHRADVDRPR